jgi:replication fork clamp-binding protein CrfC
MKKSTSITYNIETSDGVSMSEIEYKDYVKNEKGEENLLHYKVKNVKNNDEINAITDDVSNIEDIAKAEINMMNESFNKIFKVDDIIDETIGISVNNNEWKIHEYKNHKFDKEYVQEYDTIKFDINYDLLQKKETKNYIKDNK